ncbi:hypothetical protein [Streptomyces sp. NBC_01314]|uniref:hypothetical protein n=1 Tax=Streptomyces sp. NBC_01314 TaxID=2903821 RepID=UPI003089CB5C|nr:hypothetical protein OG622_14260 [Streptomyces sp. NBC_01314]
MADLDERASGTHEAAGRLPMAKWADGAAVSSSGCCAFSARSGGADQRGRQRSPPFRGAHVDRQHRPVGPVGGG